jgi:hypothetical protein
MSSPLERKITLRHPGGELRTVDVVHADKKSLYVAWPMCGTYRLSLTTNRLIGRANAWRAIDIFAAWALYDEMKGLVGTKGHRKLGMM